MRFREYLRWKKVGFEIWWEEWRGLWGWIGEAILIVIAQALPFIAFFYFVLPLSINKPRIYPAVGVGIGVSIMLGLIELLIYIAYDDFKQYNPEKEAGSV